MRIIYALNKSFSNKPLRTFFTLFSFSIGASAIMLVYNLNFELNKNVENAIEKFESVIVVANGELTNGNHVEYEEPRFGENNINILESELPEIEHINLGTKPLDQREIQVGAYIYRARNISTAGEDYLEMFDLKLIRGSFFSQGDITNKNAFAVISRETAEILFGSTADAIGKNIYFINKVSRLDADLKLVEKVEKKPFTVIGVMENLTRFQTRILKLPDILVPSSLYLSPDNLAHQYIIQIKGMPSNKAMGRIIDTLNNIYNHKIKLSIWAGSPSGPYLNTYLDSLKRMVFSISLFFGFLGFLILVVSCFGIFGIMLIRTFERTKDIGLMRSLGCTKNGIILQFMIESLIISIAGCILGLILASLFNQSFIAALKPLMNTQNVQASAFSFSNFLNIGAILFGIITTLVLGSLFSLIPAYIASRISPVECFRENG